VRQAALARQLVDTKVAAIDADWCALKLVWRREARTRLSALAASAPANRKDEEQADRRRPAQ
jgi:hypothetical protein